MVLRLVSIHDFSFTCNFSFLLRTLPNPKAQRPSTQAELCDRQIPHSFSGRSKNRAAERRHKRRYAWLTNARRRSVTSDDLYLRRTGPPPNPPPRIISTISSLHHSI